jgi:peptide/nickel transport system substrate-binding protein
MIVNSLNRRGFLKASALLSAGSLFGVPLFSDGARAQAQKLTVRMDNDISILDPGYMVGGTEIETQNACLPCLVNLDLEADVYSWKPSVYVEKFEQRDPTHYDFTLKPGFKWSNGFGELTAEDVKYSYERIKTTDWKGNFEALDHVELTDKYSGTLVLSQPYAPFAVAGLTSGGSAILCKAAMLKVGGKFTTEIPAVCGPYLIEWTPKQKIAFRPNPDWTGPKPAFAEVDALIIADASAAELAYEADELDATEITSATHARYKEKLPENSAIQVAGSLQYMWLGMNTENPKLSDIRVRKAIQHAVDANQVIQGAYAGITDKSNGIICPGLLGHRTATKYAFDPEKAKALLAEAGVSGLELELKTLNEQERILAAQIIQAQLQAVGITVKVLPLDEGPFWEMGDQSKGDGYKTLEIWLMRFGTNPDPQEATQWFTSDQVGVWNWERWKNEEYDSLYKQGMTESDQEKRAKIYLRMQEIMEDTGAYVWINHESETFVHRTSVNISVLPSGEMQLRDFTKA